MGMCSENLSKFFTNPNVQFFLSVIGLLTLIVGVSATIIIAGLVSADILPDQDLSPPDTDALPGFDVTEYQDALRVPPNLQAAQDALAEQSQGNIFVLETITLDEDGYRVEIEQTQERIFRGSAEYHDLLENCRRLYEFHEGDFDLAQSRFHPSMEYGGSEYYDIMQELLGVEFDHPDFYQCEWSEFEAILEERRGEAATAIQTFEEVHNINDEYHWDESNLRRHLADPDQMQMGWLQSEQTLSTWTADLENLKENLVELQHHSLIEDYRIADGWTQELWEHYTSGSEHSMNLFEDEFGSKHARYVEELLGVDFDDSSSYNQHTIDERAKECLQKLRDFEVVKNIPGADHWDPTNPDKHIPRELHEQSTTAAEETVAKEDTDHTPAVEAKTRAFMGISVLTAAGIGAVAKFKLEDKESKWIVYGIMFAIMVTALVVGVFGLSHGDINMAFANHTQWAMYFIYIAMFLCIGGACLKAVLPDLPQPESQEESEETVTELNPRMPGATVHSDCIDTGDNDSSTEWEPHTPTRPIHEVEQELATCKQPGSEQSPKLCRQSSQFSERLITDDQVNQEAE